MMQITIIKLALALVCALVILATSEAAGRALLDYDGCDRGYVHAFSHFPARCASGSLIGMRCSSGPRGILQDIPCHPGGGRDQARRAGSGWLWR